MVSFNPLVRKLEKYEQAEEFRERVLVQDIIQLEQQIRMMRDSPQKRNLEMKLANLNGRLLVEARKARRQHLIEARRLKKAGY